MDAHGHASTDASNTQFNAAAPGRMGAVGPRPGEPGSPTQANGAGTNRTQPHSHHVDNNSSQPQPPAHNHSHDHDHDHGRDHDHNHDHDHGHMADGIGSHRCPTAGGTGAFAGRSGEHAHTHEHLSTPGTFAGRELPVARRDFAERAFTVGVGGPVGSGKTALCLALCGYLRERHSLAVVTNDIFTREDCEFLQKNGALPAERIVAVETGGCPHAAVREDISSNLVAVEQLSARFAPEIVLVEAGGDNLAANFSRELADFIVYVIDVAGGDKIPRKGGPGITQSDLLVVNKTDLAGAVGADLGLMRTQAAQMRSYGPVVFAQVKHGVGVPEIAQMCVDAALALGAPVGKAGRRCDAPGGEPGGPEHKRPRVESGA